MRRAVASWISTTISPHRLQRRVASGFGRNSITNRGAGSPFTSGLSSSSVVTPTTSNPSQLPTNSIKSFTRLIDAMAIPSARPSMHHDPPTVTSSFPKFPEDPLFQRCHPLCLLYQPGHYLRAAAAGVRFLEVSTGVRTQSHRYRNEEASVPHRFPTALGIRNIRQHSTQLCWERLCTSYGSRTDRQEEPVNCCARSL